PWIMVAPFMSEKSYFIKNMKSKYGAATIGFSGWAKSSRFSFGRRADYSIPLSDHCDFDELVELVKQSGADKVYTIHGFVEEFSAHLKSLGIDAQPLREESLDDFI
ncbi:MAG: MBL fold metallo-hydrolase RNA specificity domain-containing protein, partial [Thermoproteota archaeon]